MCVGALFALMCILYLVLMMNTGNEIVYYQFSFNNLFSYACVLSIINTTYICMYEFILIVSFFYLY